MVEEKKEAKEKYEVVEVPTQTGLAIKDNDSDTTHNELTMLATLANDISEIKKAIVGK